MSLKAYKAFLANPSSAALADNASLHYTSTLTSIEDATAIIKHLAVQTKLLKKIEEKVISAIQGPNALSLDVETTIEFVNGGGAYLPGLDDNFLSDRKVTFPMVHMVHFDKEGKISQIRLYWDQGSLLKQVEVIGARSRNWPIRDGKEIIRLITTSTAAVDQPESIASSRRSTSSRGADEVSISERAAMNRKAGTNAMNDPHATLSLFAPREVNEDGSPVSQPIAPRAQSARPPPREYSELFVGEETNQTSPSPSPQKIPVKSGGGKNYKPSRLFDEEEENPVPTPLSVKTNSKKYNHFEFDDEESTPTVRETARTIKSKHQSQWDFDDFVTPNKVKPKVLGQAVRHFGWSDDEEENSPVRRPIVHKARPDADPHFEFVDDGTPAGEKKAVSSKGRLHNKGLGLYKDHVLGEDDAEDDTPRGDTKRALNDVTTAIKNENRAKDFGSQWEMTDDSPGPNQSSTAAAKSKAVPETRKTVVKGMEAHWGLYEDSPENHGIKAAGNGMGARKGTEAHWSLFDESPEKKENASSKSRGIKTTGDGMGGRKNADSFWDF